MKKLLTFVVLVGLLLSLQVVVASADEPIPNQEEPTEEAQPEPTEEAQPEPTEESKPIQEEPTEEAQPEPTEEAQPEPTEEAQPEPTEEAKPIQQEPTEEAQPEPTEEPAGAEQPVNQPINREAPAEPVAEDSDVGAAGAEAGPWSSTIFASNPHASSAGVVIDFYDTGGNIDASYTLPGGLNAHGSAVIDVGSVGIGDSSWQGSAVVQSENELAVQVGLYVNSSTDRELYSGFKDGSTEVFLPAAVCNAFDQTNTLAVQNVEGTDTTFDIEFKYSSGSGSDASASAIPVKAYSTTFVDPCDHVSSGWLGSATFTSNNKLVVVNHQPYKTQVKAIAYEGALQGYNKIYFPTALQKIFGVEFTSFYAVQNVGGSSTNVTLTVFDTGGSQVGTVSKTLAPLEKVSWQPKDAGAPDNFLGSAVAQAGSGGLVAGITNIGTFRIESGCPSGSGQTNAISQPGEGGGSVAVPWVENKSHPGWASFLAVQNLGTSTSGSVTVRYYNASGSLAATDSLGTVAAGAKDNSNPGSAGAGSSFQGSAEVTSSNASDQLIVLTNNRSGNGCNGSATLGIPYTP
jgi:hypothetical protein